MNEHSKETFKKNIEEIKKLYEERPNVINTELENLIRRERDHVIVTEKKSLLGDIDKELFFNSIISIVIGLLGFINIGKFENSAMYFFGYVFFLSGYYVGTRTKGFGIIFLFSHGITGLAIMIGFTLSGILNSPLMSDNSTNLYNYLFIAGAILVIATVLAILYNLSDNLKPRKYFSLIPLCTYLLGIAMIVLFPNIMNLIYNL